MWWNYKKTNFSAGGLLPTRLVKCAKNTLKTAKKFVAPRKLDFRDMCLEPSNQGSTPHCAGYATAGYIEVQNWRTNHYPEQIDGDAIYIEAKRIDNNLEDGTTLESAANAAISLGLISGTPKLINSGVNDIKFAIHSYSVCVAGFNITNEWNYVDSKGAIRNLGSKAQFLGGHAVLICGYDADGVYIQNSWGSSWGLYGFVHLSWSQYSRQFMYGLVIV